MYNVTIRESLFLRHEECSVSQTFSVVLKMRFVTRPMKKLFEFLILSPTVEVPAIVRFYGITNLTVGKALEWNYAKIANIHHRGAALSKFGDLLDF